MSPKKGNVRSIRRSTEKLRSVRKEKPYINMPTNFKVSIPLPSSGKFEFNYLQNCKFALKLYYTQL